MFFVKFHNSDRHPIDIKTYDREWNEGTLKSKLGPEEEFSHETYFTQNFLFKRSETKDRLKATANGVTSEVFEGCRFGAEPGRLLFVNIISGNILPEIVDFYFKLLFVE